MKRIFFATVVLCFSALNAFAGIKGLVFDKTVEPYKVEQSSAIPDMEFIGFKGYETSLNLKEMKKVSNFDKFGSSLQFGGIAVDASYGYFGIYSLQELGVYKNTKRYVTFVEVADFSITHAKKDYKSDCGTCCNGTPLEANQKTIVEFDIVCNIYVYDSKTKSVAYKKDLRISRKDECDGWVRAGSGEDEKTWLNVLKYYGVTTVNELLGEYKNVYTFIKNLAQ